MTKADLVLQHDRYILKVDNHADDPLVCAAVSQTVTMLANVLGSFDEHLYDAAEIRLTPGSAQIRASGDEVCAGWFRMAGAGLLGLEKEYPELIQVRMIDII